MEAAGDGGGESAKEALQFEVQRGAEKPIVAAVQAVAVLMGVCRRK